MHQCTHNSSKLLKKALVLRGMLPGGVLRSILSKRHRVDYGIHPRRKGVNMAVPFKGKDVAKDRDDFGHPEKTKRIFVVLALDIGNLS